ncbi:MAG: M14 family metallopeptidase [Leadbetterella sp.]|nr:M14 family metallopeptidase [Leadbetterella sp.]
MKTLILIMLFLPLALSAQQPAERFKGQEPIKAVDTRSRPVAASWKGTYKLGDIYISNEFDGARVNFAELENDSTVRLTVSPENQPVNSSAWYAFKIWADVEKEVLIKLVYPEKFRHRYDPKISTDSGAWEVKSGIPHLNEFIFRLTVPVKPLLVAAQPLVASAEVEQWIRSLKNIRRDLAGKSTQGRIIPVVEIGNPESRRKIVITGRQHPPEVTGHLALTHFVEAINNSKAKERFHFLVFPLLNPDGVDNGHWRHNQGGVDLNRDWAEFNQPETRAIRDYLKAKLKSTDTLLFAIDFHSTYDDIYYTLDPEFKTNATGLVNQWLTRLKSEIPGYDPNIKPLYFEPPTSTAFSYLFETYGAESLVFEIGDKTPESFIKEKSKKSAAILLDLLNARGK